VWLRDIRIRPVSWLHFPCVTHKPETWRFSGGVTNENNTYIWWLQSNSAYNRPINNTPNIPSNTNIRLLFNSYMFRYLVRTIIRQSNKHLFKKRPTCIQQCTLCLWMLLKSCIKIFKKICAKA
jgi:hypothetical protein